VHDQNQNRAVLDQPAGDAAEHAAPWDLFADIAAVTAWLDGANPAGAHEDSMRVLKLVEEAGEAAATYIGMVGQNPRKGITHSLDDLLGELADVAITALSAIEHFTGDTETTRETVAAKLRRIVARSGIRSAQHAP